MTDVSVIIPWRGGDAHREAALQFVLARIARRHPGWEVVMAGCSPGPFNRSEAIMNGAHAAQGDMLVVHDGDVFLDGDLMLSVDCAREVGWAVPHRLLHRLDETSTVAVLAGAAWRGRKLAERAYQGNETGTLVVLTRELVLDVPPDVRFVGWGQEDTAWRLALRCLVGPPWRGDADLVHLWHEPQQRSSRVVGNMNGLELYRRYRRARSDAAAMRALIEEAR